MIGWSPREVGRMTLWEFSQALAGYAKAHGGEEKPTAPTDEEHMALLAKYA